MLVFLVHTCCLFSVYAYAEHEPILSVLTRGSLMVVYKSSSLASLRGFTGYFHCFEPNYCVSRQDPQPSTLQKTLANKFFIENPGELKTLICLTQQKQESNICKSEVLGS